MIILLGGSRPPPQVDDHPPGGGYDPPPLDDPPQVAKWVGLPKDFPEKNVEISPLAQKHISRNLGEKMTV